ncbi:MAG: Glyoxalase/bleomycin resistance protein/dioxygenase [Akkermansiaceae bacterium]|nr:Glyoxalase/bleomycin resistance protein/dioxygenase [Akkermansiaceae bacterium]
MPRLNLIVLRSPDAPRLTAFYTKLGLSFQLHRHGTGPEHYASESASVVFEIYPVRKDGEPTSELRLGFEVADIHQIVPELLGAGAELVSRPTTSQWGLRAVLEDPDGHKIELTEPNV